MSRTPAFLAALASSAVPGLDPVSVRAARTEPGHRHEVAFVTDSQDRTWVVRAPLTAAAGAQMDTTVALLALIGRRLPFSVPAPRGFVAVPEGRAVVYPHLMGRPIDLGSVPAGPGLAAELGRAVAALHNIDRAVFDEAGLPAYEAEESRTRKLANLDRGAATGHVPPALLARWERVLEDVSIWRFAPTPIHGDLTGDQVLVVFEGEEDASTGVVRGITGWDDAKVADPAEDFAALISECSPEAFESVLEAYAQVRTERPDRHLLRRARLSAELRLLGGLLSAVGSGDRDLITARADDLHELDERTTDAAAESEESDAADAAEESDAADDGSGAGGSGVGDSQDPSEDTEGDHTQPLNASRSGGATRVISTEELEQLRATRLPAENAPSVQPPAPAQPPAPSADRGSTDVSTP
ncbi:macrolide 2'-phosphotransferase [Lapillicoccus sp.]|uniref:macrolide 2'-phosphotransferase n=1 Tax=Lapillicoccus sp. TaxID=1909287 RepID=UPI0039835CEB